MNVCMDKPKQILLVLVCINLNSLTRREKACHHLKRGGGGDMGNSFAEHVYCTLIKQADDDFIISPLSINIGLAILMTGATRTTREEIRTALGLDKYMHVSDFHHSYHDLIASIRANMYRDGLSLHVENRVFVGQHQLFKPEFLFNINQYFFTEAEQVNFEDAKNVTNTVNNWVAQATNNQIKELVKPRMLKNQTLMILANVVYFKGGWKCPFNSGITNLGVFHSLYGGKVEVDMMCMDRPQYFDYVVIPELGASAVALPYSVRRYNLVIILPEKPYTLVDTETCIRNGTLSNIISRMNRTLVDVRMPRLTLESSIDLIGSKVMEKLGVTRLATPSAEFENMIYGQGAYITKFVHKAVLEISEEGSETRGAVPFVKNYNRPRPSNSKNVVKFYVDKPFIAYLYDFETKSVLFIARKTM